MERLTESLELKKQKKCGGCRECGKTAGKSGFLPMLAAGLASYVLLMVMPFFLTARY